MKITSDNIDQLDWDKVDGMMPAIIQDATSGQVQMLGYMNREALQKTFDTGFATFFSRTKQRLWTKGETSGHTLDVKDVEVDCDNDTLLLQVIPNGPTCHLNTPTCWGGDAAQPSVAFISELEKVIASRKGADADSSYTASLYAKGIKRISQKVGEEGVEVALAATSGDIEELKNESADLLYHLLVLLQANDLSLKDVTDVLAARHR